MKIGKRRPRKALEAQKTKLLSDRKRTAPLGAVRKIKPFETQMRLPTTPKNFGKSFESLEGAQAGEFLTEIRNVKDYSS